MSSYNHGVGDFSRTIPTAVAVLSLLSHAAAPVLAQEWILTPAPITPWLALASSADGSDLFASSGSTYISTNSGATWNPVNVFPASFRGAACSADGATLLASGWDPALGPIVSSSTNSGSAWTTNAVPFMTFTGHLACSADGTRILLAGGDQGVSYGSAMFTSADSGRHWISNTVPFVSWPGVASSADGMKLVAVGYGLPVFRSTNFGSSWYPTTTPALKSWSTVASSADGMKLIAGEASGSSVYISIDGGANWISNSFPAQHLFALACSADARTVVAGCYPGPLYTSEDFGTTWVSNSLPVKSWISIACSADGHKLAAAAALGDGIYTRQTAPDPVMEVVGTGKSLLLSWTVPSTKCVLQQSSDLTAATWTRVTLEPTLVYTSLQYQVTLPLTDETKFYRLLAQ